MGLGHSRCPSCWCSRVMRKSTVRQAHAFHTSWWVGWDPGLYPGMGNYRLMGVMMERRSWVSEWRIPLDPILSEGEL